MRTYIGLHGGVIRHGGYQHCLNWCRGRVSGGSTAALVLTARPGEKAARVVAEVTSEGERAITNGRLVPLRKVRHE
jgi:hypothetical protein